METKTDEIYQNRKEFFNSRAESWLDMWYKDPDTGQYSRHQKDFERLWKLVPLQPGDRVLDVGCGSGILVPMVLERIKLTGILYELDFAEKMIETNRKLHKGENLHFLVQDIESASLPSNFFDVVICFSSFPHFDHKEKALLNMSDALKKEGALVVAHFSSSQELNQHHGSCAAVMHDLLPAETEMRALFQKAGLTIDLFLDEPGFYCIRAKK